MLQYKYTEHFIELLVVWRRLWAKGFVHRHVEREALVPRAGGASGAGGVGAGEHLKRGTR